MSWLEDNGWVWWLALALGLGAVEAATVDLIFLMLAGGAVAGAVASAFGVGLPFQIIAAVVVATALLGLVRPQIARRMLGGDPPALGSAAHVGAKAVVLEVVTARDGLIKLSGQPWSARAAQDEGPIAAGRTVTVVAIEGATAIVTLPPSAQDEV